MNRSNIEELNDLHVDFLNAEVNFKLLPRDIRCGLRSNIPICCILFFCVIWRLLYFFINFSLVKKFLGWYPPNSPEGCNYIPCLFCLLLRRSRKLYECELNDKTCCCYNKARLIYLSEERCSK